MLLFSALKSAMSKKKAIFLKQTRDLSRDYLHWLENCLGNLQTNRILD